MPRIERPSIKANVRTKATELDEPLRRVVARFAEALKRPKPKLVDVAPMWLDVIADGRRRDDAALEAELAERMLEEVWQRRIRAQRTVPYQASHFAR